MQKELKSKPFFLINKHLSIMQDLISEPIADVAYPTTPSSDNRQMTFGEKLVGLTFNPSNDSKVDTAKRLCAQLADLLHTEMYAGNREITELQSRLYNHTIGEILNAQMNVVKVLTLKY